MTDSSKCSCSFSLFVILAWVAAFAIKHGCADRNCTRDITGDDGCCEDFEFVMQPPRENNQTHYIGKLWRIDCRIKERPRGNVILRQDHMPRKPDGRALILEEQVFTLLSQNTSDIGEYSCEYCSRGIIVGKLVADTTKRHPTITPLEQTSILPGRNATYACEVEGVYDMSWYRVALNGSRTLMQSEGESFWKNDFRFTRRRLQILNFTVLDEDEYMCVIERSTDKYVAEKEVFLSLKYPSQDIRIPFHWYYTSFRNTEIDGHLFRIVLHVYICHLPVIVNLLVIEPFQAIVWTRNFTADQSQPMKLGYNSKYAVTLQMHVNFDGRYKDYLHVKVCLIKLTESPKSCIDVMDDKFRTTATCDNREKCRHPARNTVECPRYLDSLEEKLNATFTLTLRDPCSGIFHLQVRDRSKKSAMNGSLLDMALEKNTEARMLLSGYDQEGLIMQGKVKFSQWYLRFLVEKDTFTSYKVKLLYTIPSVGMSGNFVIMEGNYSMDCSSQGGSGKDTTKIIVAVIIGVLVGLGLLIFAAVFLYKKIKNRSSDVLRVDLLDSMEEEPDDL